MDATVPSGAALLLVPPLKHVLSPNFSSRNGQPVRLIVVHDCEGSYAGSINWFSQKASAVSAHLVLREDGAEVTQMVDFSQKAWHAVAFNSVSIGLEMAGFSAKGFEAEEWQSAANVVAWLLHRFGLPNRWAEHGAGPGFCSHYDLGAAGGGHKDPTTDSALWTHFMGLVTGAYALTPPANWTGVSTVAPPDPGRLRAFGHSPALTLFNIERTIQMRALIGAALVSTMLAGCSLNALTNPISPPLAFGSINAYGVAQSAAVAYTALPFCPLGQHASATLYCKEQPIVVKLAAADAKVQIARKALESFVHNPANYPGLTYGGLADAFRLAVTTFSQIEAQNGVH